MKNPTRSFRKLDEDSRRLASEAYHLWRELARKRGNPYRDHQYGLRAGYEAVEATLWEDGLVVLAAIRKHLDQKAVPARISEWARLEGEDRRIAEHHERELRERESPLDPAVAGIIGRSHPARRPHPATHAFVGGTESNSCAFAPDGVPCGGPLGVHVHALDQQFEALQLARRNTKPESVPCPECDEPAVPGHECPSCGTFLTTGPKDDEEHAMSLTLRLWREADARRPMRAIGE